MQPLTLEDIADQRAYERERDEFRRQVIAVKKLRRISIGPVVTMTFENRLTMRFQVQEMARAEKMSTDEQIQHELDAYNLLLPSPGELSATLFIELTSNEQLRHWLPRLLGIERSCGLSIGEGDAAQWVPSVPDAEHQEQLTRSETTSAVHYIRFHLDEGQVEAFATGPIRLAVHHPQYPDGQPGTPLSDETRAQLLADLRGS